MNPRGSILITGADGFIGRNLREGLKRLKNVQVMGFDLSNSMEALERGVHDAEFIVHLAGANRPPDVEEFQQVNVGLTDRIVKTLDASRKTTPILFASSTQAVLGNTYGQSKKAAEDLLFEYAHRSGAEVYIYRLPNIFGKWCRPNYNSVVATFCHNLSHGLPILVNDPNSPLHLVYIDDLRDEFFRAIEGLPTRNGTFCAAPAGYHSTVGEVARILQSFKDSRDERSIPNLEDPFTRKLYSTYLSALPSNGFSYPLKMNCDARGSFTEFVRTPERGQFSINISRPGVTKGNHWHETKNEKFLVVSGTGIIRFRKIGNQEIYSYPVSGAALEVIEIPPGYTHHISNLGDTDLVTVMWASEPFDPAQPDTWPEDV